MLSKADNNLITQTGRDTPMGRLMRQYWVPVLHSTQLLPGGAPHRFTVFGDKYVAFRSPDGEPGVMDEACPHRGASMALARNEAQGLRCIYHGWKISPSGALLDAPTHPPHVDLCKVTTWAHPVREGQGMIWTWLGEGAAPAFRQLAFTQLPDNQVIAATALLNCNWLHPLETLWDVFHAQMLHNQTNRASTRGSVYFSKSGRRTDEGMEFDYPEMTAHPTEYGFTHTNADAAKTTTFQFILPFIQHHTISPDPADDKGLQISVPIDDDHTLLWMIFYNKNAPLKSDGSGMRGLGNVPDRTDFLKHLGERSAENRWGQDREAMEKHGSFSGLAASEMLMTIFREDAAVIESQGRADRSAENLALVDRALIEGRRTLISAVREHEAGMTPRGRDLDLPHVEAHFGVNQTLA